MNDRKDELNQIANLVIDAYLSRNDSFVPAFEQGTEAVMYIADPGTEDVPEGQAAQKRPKLNFWYQKSDHPDRRDDDPKTRTEEDR